MLANQEQTLGLPESANPNNTCSMNALQTMVPSGSLIFLARAGSQLSSVRIQKATCLSNYSSHKCARKLARGGGLGVTKCFFVSDALDFLV